MKEIKTDTENVTLTYGEHIGHDPEEHVSFGRNPLSGASWAVVDSLKRRVVYFPTNPVTDRSGAGAKIKKAMSAYRAKYGESIFATVMVRNDVVTSVQYVSQKTTYLWDWHAHKQVIVSRDIMTDSTK